MMPVGLIAGNFLRENRWPILLLMALIVGMALAFGLLDAPPWPDNILLYIHQMAFYICVFTMFLASTAIQKERSSKRILGVLSKAVTRSQYLAGLLTGSIVAAAAFAAVFVASALWLCDRGGLYREGHRIVVLALIVVAGSAAASTVAMFFSTLLNPFVASGATALLVAPGALIGHHGIRMFYPGYALYDAIGDFSFQGDWNPDLWMLAGGIVTSVVFWLLASAVFARRDIAIAIE